MTITINHLTRVLFVPKADLTPLGGNLYLLDTDVFRLELKEHEASEMYIDIPDIHRHNTEVTLGGITLARTIEIINGYTITFEDGQYAVLLAGSNNNFADVTNVNSVSLRSNNSAGLTASADPNDIAAAVHNTAIDEHTLNETLRMLHAVLCNKMNGAGTNTVKFRNNADTADMITVTLDAQGNRTNVVHNP